MKSSSWLAAAAICLVGTQLHAEPIKVGIIAPFSGPFAVFGENFKYGIEVYRKLHGTKVAGQEIELIYRDLTGPNPAEAKALAQELIVRDKVQYIGGFVFTPNALAAAATVQQGKVPTVIFNAATSGIPTKSDYMVRTSYTLWQITVPIAKYMIDEGIKNAVTLVSDYAPGIDAETAFKKSFEANGGKVVETIRVPLKTTDFGPFMQRVKMLRPQAIYSFFPGGPPAIGVLKSYAENNLKADGIRFIGSSETNETELQSAGSSAIGIETGQFYSAAHDSPENKRFVATLREMFPSAKANLTAIEAYDGLDAIYRMIAGTGGKRDPEKAMATISGASWISPRGPMKIDPVTRHVTQNVYIRVVERDATGFMFNKEIKTYENVPDYGLTDIAK